MTELTADEAATLAFVKKLGTTRQTLPALRRGAYVLLNTQYQRLCTWVDVLVCPEDSVILGWRKADGTLRGRLTGAQHAYVARVFREAYRDLFPDEDGTLPLREWRKIRATEDTWR